jgi:4-aminobutyrate aminotransferase
MSFELVRNRDSKEKDDDRAEKIFYYCLERGLSFKLSSGNCITWHPPLIVSQEQMTTAFTLLTEAIQSTE